MKPGNRFALAVVVCGLLLSGCNRLTHYSLSEQKVNDYLQQHNDFHKSIGIPGLISADIVLQDLHSQIGREEPGKVTLAGNARFNVVSLIGSQQADVALTLKAQPYYDVEQGAIYLKDMQLVHYDVNQEKLTSTLRTLGPYLQQSLKSWFDSQPAYRLDASRNKSEALAKGLDVKPGELVIPFTR
ncbi:lipoprotein [Candidatus Sodalis endolongispinus]|uniref:Lipoprotein n=1 Tax=Candidatus Sodalis endolongispinus TaxID=2812662 RepID=A0ABS5YDE6_9GAMM|nr:lipoprotein [Candidatus Sodalis endolongispinus]MBT9432979.1 lipoprotein [Candidatus Sodalis endolongispinus]